MSDRILAIRKHPYDNAEIYLKIAFGVVMESVYLHVPNGVATSPSDIEYYYWIYQRFTSEDIARIGAFAVNIGSVTEFDVPYRQTGPITLPHVDNDALFQIIASQLGQFVVRNDNGQISFSERTDFATILSEQGSQNLVVISEEIPNGWTIELLED